jgi:hypothetical protein
MLPAPAVAHVVGTHTRNKDRRVVVSARTDAHRQTQEAKRERKKNYIRIRE